MADVLQIEIKVPTTAEAAGAGAAILAGIASNDFERIKCPSLKYETVYRPGHFSGLYEDKYKQYRSIEYKLWR